jgi:hypothetical protein
LYPLFFKSLLQSLFTYNLYIALLCAVIQHMGKKLHLRQRVVATASIYFRRLYLTYTASSSPLRMCARTSTHACCLLACVDRRRVVVAVVVGPMLRAALQE